MNIQINTDLSSKTTFGITAKSRYFIEFSDPSDVYHISSFLNDVQTPCQLLGGGSNTIFCADFPGVIIKNNCKDAHKISLTKVYVEAGYCLDDFVVWTMSQGLSGIEALSGIPGTIGGAIALNAGAYGQCIKDHLESVVVYDTRLHKMYTLTKAELHYHHRSSIFRDRRGQNLIIMSAIFHLTRSLIIPHHPKISQLPHPHTSENLRSEILSLRSHLPNPKVHRTAGSFFLNPTVTHRKALKLQEKFPDIVMKSIDTHKHQIAMGWVLERAGLKGTRHGNFSMHANHANIIVNESPSASGNELIKFIQKIQSIIYDLFELEIVPEPLLVGEEFWQGSFYTPSLNNPVLSR